MFKHARFLNHGKSLRNFFWQLQKKFSRPLARKHCYNGGPDTDGNWDKAQKKRERQEGKETKGNYSKYINMLASLRAYATRHGKALGVAREQSRGNTARSHLWPLALPRRFAPRND